jgi:hypothetical protein
MHQRRGLQNVARRFASHITLRKPVKFAVHQGRQLLQRTLIPVAPGLEQLGYLVSGGPRHNCLPYVGLQGYHNPVADYTDSIIPKYSGRVLQFSNPFVAMNDRASQTQVLWPTLS